MCYNECRQSLPAEPPQTNQDQRAKPTVDIKITIPELTDVRPFWIRGCPLHITFAELYQDCINHEEIRRSRQSLDRISRHFWLGDRFLPRSASLASQMAADADAHPEISLVLRRDLYRVGPPEAVNGHIEYTYVDAEDRIDKVVALIVNKAERPSCFDLSDWRGRRLASDKSLAFHELWPAWEDAKTFPDRARLRLRPRIGWLAYALLALALLGGLGLGYWLCIVLLNRQAV